MEFLLFIIFVFWLAYYVATKTGYSNQAVVQQKQYSEIFKFEFEESNSTIGKYLIVDTETTGLPRDFYANLDDVDNWPKIIQLSWLLFDCDGYLIDHRNHYLKQKCKIDKGAIQKHGITEEYILENGISPERALLEFSMVAQKTDFIVSHNIDFDLPVLNCEFIRNKISNKLLKNKTICTMKKGTSFCKIPRYSGGYKYPTLEELFTKCFYSFASNASYERMHRADIDVLLAAKCFFKLKDLNIIKK